MIQWWRSSLQPSLLHKQKAFAERVGPCREVFTWKGVAIPEAVIDTVQDGACQDRAGSSEDLLLGTQFFFCFFTSSGATGGTKPKEIQFADVTINTTCAGRHEVTSIGFQ